MTRKSLLHLATILALAASAPPAHAQGAAPAESTRVGILFDSDAPIRLRLAGDLKTLLGDRDSLTAVYHPFALTYQVEDAEPVSLDAELKTRGHWRRQKRNCDFPPLWVNVPRRRVAGTLFAGQDKLKLVTPCRPGRAEFREYVLREYLVYRLHNLLTPLSLRARLATTTYVDTAGRMDSLTVQTFLIEDADQMAARNDGKLLDTPGAAFADMDSVAFGMVGVFMYMIGATDWSLRGLHNMELVLGLGQGQFFAVPYDFDYAGIVNTAYAAPDPRLRIRTVRQRLYRGACLTGDQWEAVLATFRERKAALYAVYDSLPGVSERYLRDTRRYLDEFYRVIEDPGRTSRELVRRCWQQEGV
jgi:hypothetical protein